MAGKRRTKPAAATEEAEAAAGDVEEALEDAENAAAAGDEEEYTEAIAEAQKLLKQLQDDVSWLKSEMKKAGDVTAPMNSALEKLTGQVGDLQTRMTELTEKFQSLTQAPPSSVPPEPGKETPGVQAVTELPPKVEYPENVGAPKAPEIQAKRTKRFI